MDIQPQPFHLQQFAFAPINFQQGQSPPIPDIHSYPPNLQQIATQVAASIGNYFFNRSRDSQRPPHAGVFLAFNRIVGGNGNAPFNTAHFTNLVRFTTAMVLMGLQTNPQGPNTNADYLPSIIRKAMEIYIARPFNDGGDPGLLNMLRQVTPQHVANAIMSSVNEHAQIASQVEQFGRAIYGNVGVPGYGQPQQMPQQQAVNYNYGQQQVPTQPNNSSLFGIGNTNSVNTSNHAALPAIETFSSQNGNPMALTPQMEQQVSYGAPVAPPVQHIENKEFDFSTPQDITGIWEPNIKMPLIVMSPLEHIIVRTNNPENPIGFEHMKREHHELIIAGTVVAAQPSLSATGQTVAESATKHISAYLESHMNIISPPVFEVSATIGSAISTARSAAIIAGSVNTDDVYCQDCVIIQPYHANNSRQEELLMEMITAKSYAVYSNALSTATNEFGNDAVFMGQLARLEDYLGRHLYKWFQINTVEFFSKTPDVMHRFSSTYAKAISVINSHERFKKHASCFPKAHIQMISGLLTSGLSNRTTQEQDAVYEHVEVQENAKRRRDNGSATVLSTMLVRFVVINSTFKDMGVNFLMKTINNGDGTTAAINIGAAIDVKVSPEIYAIAKQTMEPINGAEPHCGFVIDPSGVIARIERSIFHNSVLMVMRDNDTQRM